MMPILDMIWYKKILLLISLSLLISSYTYAKVYIVSVGISDYPGVTSDLLLPALDAKTITWLYSKNMTGEYRLLLDHNATTSNIKKAMKNIFSQAKENDSIVLFYAGHGFQGGFYTYDGPLFYKEIRDIMSRCKCKIKIVYADTCFSGKIKDEKVNVSKNDINNVRKANIMLFLSSRGNETSIESSYMKNGLFTNYLQKGLRGSADANKDRLITAKELYNYVHTNVIQHSNNEQHPVMWGNFPHNMIIMKW